MYICVASKGTHEGEIFLSPVNQKLYPTKNPIFFNKFFSNILDILFMLHKEAKNRI